MSIRQRRISGEDEEVTPERLMLMVSWRAFSFYARLACERENMTMDPTQISVAIIMVGVSVTLIVWLRSSMAAASDRRMVGMMTRVGLDPRIATFGDLQTVAIRKIIRRRCRRCPREGLCERWLAGKVEGDNSFCPNAQTFRILTGVSLQEPAGAPVDTRSAAYLDADTEIAMKTITEKSKHKRNTNNSPAPLRLPEVMSIAQREQTNAFIQFLESWRRTGQCQSKLA